MYNKKLIKEVNRLLKEEGKSPDIVAYRIRQDNSFNVKVSYMTEYVKVILKLVQKIEKE